MAKASDKNRKNQAAAGNDNDVYTAILGLAALVLGATAIFVCLRAQQLFDTFL